MMTHTGKVATQREAADVNASRSRHRGLSRTETARQKKPKVLWDYVLLQASRPLIMYGFEFKYVFSKALQLQSISVSEHSFVQLGDNKMQQQLSLSPVNSFYLHSDKIPCDDMLNNVL